MGDAFQRATAGQPFRPQAAAWNAFIDAARWVRDNSTGPLPTPKGESLPAGMVFVKNTSDEDRVRFEILGLDGVLIEPTEEDAKPFLASRWAMKGAKPAEEHRGSFVVLQEPVAKNALGRAMILGVTAVKLQVDHEGLRYADVLPDDPTKLQATAAGAAVLWKESGTGEKWAVVSVGPGLPCTAIAVLTEELAAGGSAEAKVWAVDDGSPVETDHRIDVHGWMLDGERTIESGARILAASINGRWEAVEVFPDECFDVRDPRQWGNYVEGERQILSHAPSSGCLEWMNTDADCAPPEE